MYFIYPLPYTGYLGIQHCVRENNITMHTWSQKYWWCVDFFFCSSYVGRASRPPSNNCLSTGYSGTKVLSCLHIMN